MEIDKTIVAGLICATLLCLGVVGCAATDIRTSAQRAQIRTSGVIDCVKAGGGVDGCNLAIRATVP